MGIQLDLYERGPESLIRDIRDFRDEVLCGLKELCGAEFTVEGRDVEKNNGVLLYGISIMGPEEKLAPTIYVEPLFNEYIRGTMNVKEAENEILKIYSKEKMRPDIDVSVFSDFEKISSMLTFRLINAERNSELLKEVPHRMYLDMAVVYTVYVPDVFDGAGNVLVRNSLMKAWGTDEETLFRLSRENTPRIKEPVIKDLSEMLLSILESPEEEKEEMERTLKNGSGISMYVLTNSDKFYGDAVILYPELLKDLSEEIGPEFYLLPSSVHEFIAVPCMGNANEEDLYEMVKSVNRTSVGKEDFLSDNVYVCKDGEMTICQTCVS